MEHKVASEADEVLLVVDAMTGQEAATLTSVFNEKIGITGAVLTKMDGDTRGGAALSVQVLLSIYSDNFPVRPSPPRLLEMYQSSSM